MQHKNTMIENRNNIQPVIGKKEGVVPFKVWQNLPFFKPMHEYTQSQNMGQTYNGVEKYKTMENGHLTGQGYAFEDLHEQAKVEAGHVMEKVPAKKNGADYIDNGEPVQLKYSRDGGKLARNLYERKEEDDAYGTYRYTGQTIVVPKGKGKYVKWHASNRRRNGYFDNPKTIEESPVTCDTVDAYFYKGKESFKMDMKDPNLVIPAAKGGLVVGSATYVTARIMLAKRCSKKGKKMTWKHELLAAGIGTLSAVASGAAFLFAECGTRQDLRPELE